jgi:hypothetical protein
MREAEGGREEGVEMREADGGREEGVEMREGGKRVLK